MVIGMTVAMTFRFAAALHKATPQIGQENMNSATHNRGQLETM